MAVKLTTVDQSQGQRCILPIQARSGQDKLDKTPHLYPKPKNYETASLPYLTGRVCTNQETCCSEALLGIKQKWSSPMVLVTKKDGTPKILHLLQASEHGICLGADLLLCTDDSVSVFSTAKWFSTLDLSSGYWQIPMNLASSGKAAFVTSSGLHDRTIVPRPSCPSGLVTT